jgi:hydrogenase maturation protease
MAHTAVADAPTAVTRTAATMRIERAGQAAGVLIFGLGNPSRGDDAIGPLLIEQLEADKVAGRLDGVDLLTDFQLQPEHALDLRGRRHVVFVDAAESGAAPFVVSRVRPAVSMSVSTHSTAPSALLAVYASLYGDPPAADLIAVKADRFHLGSPPSAAARRHLASVRDFLLRSVGCAPT